MCRVPLGVMCHPTTVAWRHVVGRDISSPPANGALFFGFCFFSLLAKYVCHRTPAATDAAGCCVLRLCIEPVSPYPSFFHEHSVVPRELTKPPPSSRPPPPPPLRRRTARTPALTHTPGARTLSREARRLICGSWPGAGPPGFARLAGASTHFHGLKPLTRLFHSVHHQSSIPPPYSVDHACAYLVENP